MEREIERRPADLPRVREYQREVYERGARFKLLLCGWRWGKSKLGVLAACEGHGPAAENGRPVWKGALDGGRIAWVVPSEEHPAAAEVDRKSTRLNSSH